MYKVDLLIISHLGKDDSLVKVLAELLNAEYSIYFYAGRGFVVAVCSWFSVFGI